MIIIVVIISIILQRRLSRIYMLQGCVCTYAGRLINDIWHDVNANGGNLRFAPCFSDDRRAETRNFYCNYNDRNCCVLGASRLHPSSQ